MSDHENSRTIGKRLEDTMDLVHDLYFRRGQADIWHEGTRAIPTAHGWKAVSSRPDYMGVLKGGRAIAYDAKHWATSGKYRHSKDRGHQLMKLWDIHEMGGIAGLLVVNLHEDWAFWICPRMEWNIGEFSPVTLDDETGWVYRVPKHPDVSEFMPDFLQLVGVSL